MSAPPHRRQPAEILLVDGTVREHRVRLRGDPREHLGVFEHRVDERRGGVGHGVEPRDVRARQHHGEVVRRHGARVLRVRAHDVVDQHRLAAAGPGTVGGRDGLAQLEYARLGPTVPRVLQQDLRALPGHQHIEHVPRGGADVVDVLRPGRSGEDLAELVGHHVLHRPDHRHPSAWRPVPGDGAVGDGDQLVQPSFECLA
ncbi:MAG TPA: hypothetical protein VGQ92_21270 [Actinoplanes sp.]|nr:hypothetical protein [Actinoplanes sp.]